MIKYYQDKFNELFTKSFPSLPLSRRKFLFAFLLSLIEQRSVQFPVLAKKLNSSSKSSSNLRRIQRFFADFSLDYDQFACLWMCLISKKNSLYV